MLTLKVHALEQILFTGPAECVTLPGREGELTVYDNHMPLLTTLRSGTITVRLARDDEPKRFTVTGGTLEVRPGGKVTVLVEVASVN